MSDDNGPIIWVSSSSSESSAEDYATCAEDTIDLELSDRDEICDLIRTLALREEQAADDLDNERATADRTSYRIGPTTSTTRWAAAGTAQLGGAHVVAEQKRKKRRHKRYPYHVVFIGRPPGVHTGWESAKAATEGVEGNCVKGYATCQEAQNAWDYAEVRGWVGGYNGQRPIPRIAPAPLDLEARAPPQLNVLCPSDRYRRYHAVYRGQRPGIYASIIEANLSAVGVPTSLHDSFESITLAKAQYQAAIEHNEIHIIPLP